MLDGLSIFLPAYNEEGNIEKAVLSALATAHRVSKNFEVVVVLYEGSTDGTRDRVNQLIKDHKHVRLVIQPEENKGYGAALHVGIHSCIYSYIFYTDADNQFDIAEISKLIPYLDTYDIVSGYRDGRKDPFLRILSARIYNFLLNILFKTHFKDVDSAFKIYKKKIFEKITITHKTGIVDAEIFIKAQRQGFKIIEIPVHHYSRFTGLGMFADNRWGLIKVSVVINLLKDMFSLHKELSNKTMI